MRFLHPQAVIPVLVLAIVGVIVRGVIYLIDRKTEPDIMHRHINAGSETFFAREAIEGDPMINELTGRRMTPDEDGRLL